MFERRDSALFLGMVKSGGGPFTMSGLIFAYDYVNRDVLDVAEMEGALNRLLAVNLIECDDGLYTIPEAIQGEFDRFRECHEEEGFDVAEAYLKAKHPVFPVETRIELVESEYKGAYDSYSRAMRKAYDEDELETEDAPIVSRDEFYQGKHVFKIDWYLCVTVLPEFLDWAQRRTFDRGGADVRMSPNGTRYGFEDADCADQFLIMREFVSIPELVEKVGDLGDVVFADVVPPSWPDNDEADFEYRGQQTH